MMLSWIKWFLFFNCLWVTHALQGHELNFGLFDLYEVDDSFYLEIRLDKDKTLEAIGKRMSDQKIETLLCELTEYLDNNLNLAINDQSAALDYSGMTYTDEVIVIQARLEIAHQPVSEIKITNTVLLSTVDNQFNIIKASFHDRNRSFRLHADRTSTLIKY